MLGGVGAGSALGLALGKGLGVMFTGLYAVFFRFPSFEHRLPPDLVLLAIPASLDQVTAQVTRLRAASAERDSRRTGAWLVSPEPLDEQALAPLRRALQVQGIGAVGSGPVEF